MPTQAREKATAIVLHAVRLAVLGGAAILAYLLLSLLDGPAHADPAVPTPPVGHDARSHDARSHPEIMPLGAVLESTSSVADQASDVLDDAAVADATRAVPTTAPARIPTTARITTPAPVTGTAPVPLAAKAIPAVPAAARVLGTVPGVADTVPAVLGNVPRARSESPIVQRRQQHFADRRRPDPCHGLRRFLEHVEAIVPQDARIGAQGRLVVRGPAHRTDTRHSHADATG